MTIRLYAIPISNPSNAVRGMLAYKRLNHRLVKFQPGFHAALVRAAGFPGLTVPALEVDGRKIQDSIAISHFLEELRPDPPLYPADPGHRRAVEAAEQWGDAELQPVSRRIFRQALVEQTPMRRWLASRMFGPRFAGVGALLALPLTRAMASLADSTSDVARRDIARLPETLDRVDALLVDGTIGGAQPTAADFQLLASVCSLGLMVDLQPVLEGRPCERAAAALFPNYDGTPTPPNSLPADWLTPLS